MRKGKTSQLVLNKIRGRVNTLPFLCVGKINKEKMI